MSTDEQPIIYVYCVALGTGSGTVADSTVGGDVMGVALAEDGTCLARHLSSNKWFSQQDMGTHPFRPNKHDRYAAHYPDGFRLVWLEESELGGHPGFQAAWARNQERLIEQQQQGGEEQE